MKDTPQPFQKFLSSTPEEMRNNIDVFDLLTTVYTFLLEKIDSSKISVGDFHYLSGIEPMSIACILSGYYKCSLSLFSGGAKFENDDWESARNELIEESSVDFGFFFDRSFQCELQSKLVKEEFDEKTLPLCYRSNGTAIYFLVVEEPFQFVLEEENEAMKFIKIYQEKTKEETQLEKSLLNLTLKD